MNGGDLRFFNQNNRELEYEIDEWNATGESLVWVKVIDFSTESKILARWGNDLNTTAPPLRPFGLNSKEYGTSMIILIPPAMEEMDLQLRM